MFHKAEEWKLLQKVPKFKLVKEYGRSRRLDDESERKLIAAAATCGWRKASFELFRDIVLAVRETGMRDQRELYHMRVENIDWTNKVIFVPDSKTAMAVGLYRLVIESRKSCGNVVATDGKAGCSPPNVLGQAI